MNITQNRLSAPSALPEVQATNAQAVKIIKNRIVTAGPLSGKTAAGNNDADIYTALVNQACKAIRSMPISLVTGEYIAQILATLSCKATEAGMDRESDVLGCAYIEVQ